MILDSDYKGHVRASWFSLRGLSKILSFLLYLSYTFHQISSAQFRITGQGSAAFVKSNDGFSQYSFNSGRGTFAWRWDVFADALVSDNISLFSNFRMLQDQTLHVDYFALRVMDVASSGINVEAGLIDIPFGSLAERRYPMQNPFFNLPLMNEHITALCASDYRVWTLIPAFAVRGDGVRLLDQGLYDLGVMVYGKVGIAEYAAALINGMVSTTSTYAPQGLNPNKGYGKVFRFAVTPTTGLKIGASYAFGPFMKDQSADSNSAIFGEDPDEYPQHIIGGDIDFSFEHFSFYGQAAYNIWKFEEEHYGSDLKAFAYSAEGRYAITPRVSVALRIGGLVFNSINAPLPSFGHRMVPYSGKWDHDIIRLEGSVDYRLAREVLIKFVYQWNNTMGVVRDPVDNLVVLQTVFAF